MGKKEKKQTDLVEGRWLRGLEGICLWSGGWGQIVDSLGWSDSWSQTRWHKKNRLLAEPPLDWHMPVFTGKCFPSTGKKYSCWYQVPAETERFVWLSRDHTLYPGSWSKWKLPLNNMPVFTGKCFPSTSKKYTVPVWRRIGTGIFLCCWYRILIVSTV